MESFYANLIESLEKVVIYVFWKIFNSRKESDVVLYLV